VSRSAFATRFHEIVGATPKLYLIRWRMALAKEALRSRSIRVEELAFSIGYQSASAFSSAFTRSVGCSPTRYAEGWRGLS
jgi:AraC-like DNA-binding protein